MSGQLHAPVALTPGKKPPGTLRLGSGFGPSFGMDDKKK
jgi:hypothetical protein